jgi:hypothetical protein
VEFPDLGKLPYTMAGGVKEFHLIAEVVHTEFMPGRPVDALGLQRQHSGGGHRGASGRPRAKGGSRLRAGVAGVGAAAE